MRPMILMSLLWMFSWLPILSLPATSSCAGTIPPELAETMPELGAKIQRGQLGYVTFCGATEDTEYCRWLESFLDDLTAVYTKGNAVLK